MSSLRVALFSPTLEAGGVARMCFKLCQGFARAGLHVDLLVGDAYGDFLGQVPRGVRLIDFRARHVLYALPALTRYLRREQPAALIALMTHTTLTALVARRLARVRTKIIATEHIHMGELLRHTSAFKVKLMPYLAGVFFPQADSIVAVSRGVAEDFVRATGVPAASVRVIYNPVLDADLFSKAWEQLQHPWFAAGEPPVILSVGRLMPQKDFGMLVKAFARVRQQRPARLLILGDGEEKENLERLVRTLNLQGDVALPGYESNPYRYMARSAVFALSSKWEGFGIVLVEALALGARIVSTDCPSGPNEILQGGKLGALVPVNDIEAMARALVDALQKSARPAPLSQLRSFEQHTVTQSYLELFCPAATQSNVTTTP